MQDVVGTDTFLALAGRPLRPEHDAWALARVGIGKKAALGKGESKSCVAANLEIIQDGSSDKGRAKVAFCLYH